MFKYKKLIAFFIISVLFIGSAIIYIVLADIAGNVQNKTVSTQNKVVDNNYYNTEESSKINQQIENLIKGYLNANLNDDMSAMKSYVNDIKFLNEKKIIAQNQYIESYENIKCTIKKCSTKDTYRVYVYYDLKAFDVEAGLPSLSAFCVKKDEDGNFRIFLGKIGNDVQKEIEKLDKADDVTALKQSVQKRMNELISTDEQVRSLFETLDSLVNR